MRISKAQKFEKEQYMIQQELIALLELEENGNGFYLYEMDRDQEKINQIMNMAPEIWRYFAHMNVTGLLYPERCKRPWLSIVRGVLKNEWKLRYKPCRYNSETEGSVFTMRYFLVRRREDESESFSDYPSRAGTPDMLASEDSVSYNGGTMSTNPSCESLCSLDGDGRRKLKVSKRKSRGSRKKDNYQVNVEMCFPQRSPAELMRRVSQSGIMC